MNVANLITVLRFPLLVFIVLLLFFGAAAGQLIAVPLIVALILMDSALTVATVAAPRIEEVAVPAAAPAEGVPVEGEAAAAAPAAEPAEPELIRKRKAEEEETEEEK